LQKKIENGSQTNTLISGFFTVVTFSDRPYAEALAIGDEQNAIMEEVLKTENIESGIVKVENMILALLDEKKLSKLEVNS
jgi:kynurenine 3-monooxygenase